MALHLVILDRDNASSDVAGVHPIARLVNSARQAGIDEITLGTELDSNSLSRIQDSVPGSSHRKRIRRVSPDVSPGSLGRISTGDHMVFIDTGVLVNGDFYSFLSQSLEGVDKPVRIRIPDYPNLFWAVPWSYSHLLKDVDLSAAADHFSRLYPNGQIPEATPPRDSYVDVSRSGQPRKAERWLVRQSIKASDGMVSRYLNRPISTRITRMLIPYSIRPAQFTALLALGTLAMLAMLVTGNPVLLAAGCVAYHILSVLDGTDGELARVKFMSTDWGARLDTSVDMATNLLFVVGLHIGLYRIYGGDYAVVGEFVVFGIGLCILLLMLLVRFGPGGGSFDILARAIEVRIVGRPRLQRLVAGSMKLFKRDFYALLFAVLGVLGFARIIPWFLILGIAGLLTAIVLNASYILRAQAEDILPEHILEHRIV